MIKGKMSSGKEFEISDEKVMLYGMSQAINQWLHKKGDDVHRYGNFMDRTCDIQDVLEESLLKTAEHILKAKEEGKWTEDSSNSDK